ncbi:MAG: tetratricopeptide repeat protein [Bacteroidota bacterium]
MKTGNTPEPLNLHNQSRKAAYEKKLESDPGNVSALWGYAKLLYELKNIDDATRILHKILELNEKNFDGGLLLIECYLQKDKSEEALAHIRKMEGWYPNNARVLRKLALVSLDANDPQSSKVYLDRLIELWPDQSDTWVTKAEFLTLSGKRIEAIKAWEMAHRMDKTNAKAQLYLGIDACVTEQFVRAETLLSAAVISTNGEEPDKSLACYYLAFCNRNLGYGANRFIELIRNIDETCLDLENERIRYNLAELWVIAAQYEFDQNNYEDAVKYLEKVEAKEIGLIKPESFANFCFAYAESCHDNGHKELAAKYAEKASQLDPGKKEYQERFTAYRKELKTLSRKSKTKSSRKLVKPIILLLLVAGGWFAYPYVKEPTAWCLARAQNTINAYDRYIEQFPEGKYLTLAITKGEEALWKKIAKNPIIDDVEYYLERFPEGSFVKEVTEQREEAYWLAAIEENTIDGYFRYFQAYPNGKYNVSITDHNEVPDGNNSEELEYIKATVRDSDGYTNVRKGKGTKTAVISKVYRNQPFFVQPRTDQNWWKVILADGTRGFIHKSRINLK